MLNSALASLVNVFRGFSVKKINQVGQVNRTVLVRSLITCSSITKQFPRLHLSKSVPIRSRVAPQLEIRRMSSPKSSPREGGGDDVQAEKGNVKKSFLKTFSSLSLKQKSRQIDGVKEKYLKMDLEEKRKEYKCKDKYVQLQNILTWKDYFVKNNVRVLEFDDDDKPEVNDDLNQKVSIYEGDITALEIDAVVNAANSSLLGGGGVDGAIHSAAGRGLYNECKTLKGCGEGKAKITGGYRLPAKYVIHTVGPQSEKPDALRACYENSLKLMVENNLRSIAFCCIATGIYGYPNDHAANVALMTVRKFMEKKENAEKIDRVIFTVFLEKDKKFYEKLMQKYFPLK